MGKDLQWEDFGSQTGWVAHAGAGEPAAAAWEMSELEHIDRPINQGLGTSFKYTGTIQALRT